MSEQRDAAVETRRREIVIVRVFDAPRDLVFRAWTEPERLARWWGPEGFSVPACESHPRPGGVLRIVMRGPDGIEHTMNATYREVVPPERLVVESGAVADDGTALLEGLTTVTFADRDGRTEVTVRAEATALVPQAIAMLGGMEAGWRQSLQCLDDVLTGTVDRQFVLTRVFEAARETVFRAWTDPEQIARWYGPGGFGLTIHEMDVRPGGAWRFTVHGPDGVDYPNDIVYDEIAPPERLAYTHAEPPFRVTVTFDEFAGLTALTYRMVFGSAAERDTVVERHHAIDGANQTLDRLGAHLAAG